MYIEQHLTVSLLVVIISNITVAGFVWMSAGKNLPLFPDLTMLLREVWVEDKQSFIAPSCSLFANPHPLFSDPTNSLKNVWLYAVQVSLLILKYVTTGAQTDFCYDSTLFQSNLSQHTDPAIPKHRARRNSSTVIRGRREAMAPPPRTACQLFQTWMIYLEIIKWS